MLDEYKSAQDIAYNIFNNAVLNKKLSHAYLIDANENPDALNIALCFAKMIICSETSSDQRENIIKRINDGNYLDIKIIKAESMWIKKEEVINLQNEFSKVAIEGKKKIYIICEAEKMNMQTSNSLLKFLEEPVDDIIAILIVNNINLVLPTIISRCQQVKLLKKEYEKESVANFRNRFKNAKYSELKEEEVNQIIDNVFSFASFIENNGIDTLVYVKKMWHNYFKDRDDNVMAMELFVNIYFDALKNKCNIINLFFSDRVDKIQEIAMNNDILNLSKKIEVIVNSLNSLKNNVNINLLIDKLIIDMCGDL